MKRAHELAEIEATRIPVAAYHRQKGCITDTDGLGSKGSADELLYEMAGLRRFRRAIVG